MENSSRRKFVKDITAMAAVGALSCLKTARPAEKGSTEALVAPCGLYCGACPMYLATRDNDQQRIDAMLKQFGARDMKLSLADVQCDGCIAGGRVASFCRKCAMRECAESKPDVTRCSDCSDFPCSKVTNFNNDGMLHHAEVLENCRRLRQAGIKQWAKLEAEKWSCPKCKANIGWYDASCAKCGAPRSDRLFPLKKA